MPQLRFHAINIETVKQVSKAMTEELAAVADCPTDHFVLECIQSTYVFDGKVTKSWPYVEVYWFDRGDAAADATARIITEHLKQAGLAEIEVAFVALEKRRFYTDGEHY